MKIKVTGEIKYRKNSNAVDVKPVLGLLKRTASKVFLESHGTAIVDGENKRFVTLRIYGDWK